MYSLLSTEPSNNHKESLIDTKQQNLQKVFSLESLPLYIFWHYTLVVHVYILMIILCTCMYLQLKSVRIGRNNRRIRVEGQDCDDWMAVEMGEWCCH